MALPLYLPPVLAESVNWFSGWKLMGSFLDQVQGAEGQGGVRLGRLGWEPELPRVASPTRRPRWVSAFP